MQIAKANVPQTKIGLDSILMTIEINRGTTSAQKAVTAGNRQLDQMHTCESADVYVIFLIQPDWGAANVTPGHEGGCIRAGSEGGRVHHSIASDSPWLLCLHACLGPSCLLHIC